jgi:hypothetical protein
MTEFEFAIADAMLRYGRPPVMDPSAYAEAIRVLAPRVAAAIEAAMSGAHVQLTAIEHAGPRHELGRTAALAALRGDA